MQKIDLLIYAGWVIPVEPEGTVLTNHAVAVHEGQILDILPTSVVGNRYQASTVKQLGQHALLPGFINSHTHAAMSLMRGLADDLPLMEWLNQHIWPAESKWVNEEFVRDGTMLAVAEMVRGGTTCFNDMYFFPDVTAKVCEQAGLRAMVGLIALDFPTVWAQTPSDYINKGLELFDKLKNSNLIRTAFAPHAPYTISDAPLDRIRTLADELDIPVHMHVHESVDEIEQSRKKYKVRPLERLNRLGLLSPTMMAVHMTHINDDELELICQAGVHIVHCPESNLKLASGFCPVKRLIDAGANVALGTDGAASNNDLDMISEMRSAALLGKAVSENAAALSAAQVLSMATINGARALGLSDETGSLVAGKRADIIAIDLAQIETQPLYNPVSQIVYASSRNQVTDVWVNGKQLLDQRKLTTLDEEKLLIKAQIWSERIASTDKGG